jgi:hypothetical protein
MGTGVTLSTKSPENLYWSLAFGLGSLIKEQESKAQDQSPKTKKSNSDCPGKLHHARLGALSKFYGQA